MPQGNPDPQVVPYLLYADAGAAMDWLIKVFAFTERTRDKNTYWCSMGGAGLLRRAKPRSGAAG